MDAKPKRNRRTENLHPQDEIHDARRLSRGNNRGNKPLGDNFIVALGTLGLCQRWKG